MSTVLLHYFLLLLASMIINKKIVFRNLFNRYYKPLLALAVYIVQSSDDAEDIVQGVFLKLWKNEKSFQSNEKAWPYLKTSVKNQCLNLLEKNRSKNEYLNQLDYDNLIRNSPFSDHLLLEKINSSINKLPDRCKEVFIKSRVLGMSHKEISTEMLISVKTVENQMTKALKFLRDQLANIISLMIFIL